MVTFLGLVRHFQNFMGRSWSRLQLSFGIVLSYLVIFAAISFRVASIQALLFFTLLNMQTFELINPLYLAYLFKLEGFFSPSPGGRYSENNGLEMTT